MKNDEIQADNEPAWASTGAQKNRLRTAALATWKCGFHIIWKDPAWVQCPIAVSTISQYVVL
jgi:hypothetical protein